MQELSLFIGTYVQTDSTEGGVCRRGKYNRKLKHGCCPWVWDTVIDK